MKEQGKEDHFYIYEELVKAEYENKRQRLIGGDITPYAITYTAKNGAGLSYDTSGASVLMIHMTKSQTQTYRNAGSYAVGSNIYVWLVGLVPYGFGIAFGFSYLAQYIADSYGWKSIDAGNGCARITIAIDDYGSTSRVVSNWSTYPDIVVVPNATNISIVYTK